MLKSILGASKGRDKEEGRNEKETAQLRAGQREEDQRGEQTIRGGRWI